MHLGSPLLFAASAVAILLAPGLTSPRTAPEPACGPSAWAMVFRNDTLGRDAGGKRGDLLNALRRGSPIRVAWGELTPDGTSVVEFAEPILTNLMGERDVVPVSGTGLGTCRSRGLW